MATALGDNPEPKLIHRWALAYYSYNVIQESLHIANFFDKTQVDESIISDMKTKSAIN